MSPSLSSRIAFLIGGALALLASVFTPYTNGSGTVAPEDRDIFEGKDIRLYFAANVQEESFHYSLSFNGTVIVIDDKQILSLNFPIQRHRRFNISKKIFHGYVLVTADIKQPVPADAGIYKCEFNSSSLSLVQEYNLTIFHKPGRANCAWVSDANDQRIQINPLTSRLLECRFQAGYPPGKAICYVTGANNKTRGQTSRAALLVGPEDNEVISVFEIEKEEYVSCCSVNEHFRKGQGDCSEFTTSKQESKGKTIAVPPTTPVTRYNTHYLTTYPTSEVKKENFQNQLLFIVLFSISLFFNLLIIIVYIKVSCKCCSLKKTSFRAIESEDIQQNIQLRESNETHNNMENADNGNSNS